MSALPCSSGLLFCQILRGTLSKDESLVPEDVDVCQVSMSGVLQEATVQNTVLVVCLSTHANQNGAIDKWFQFEQFQ